MQLLAFQYLHWLKGGVFETANRSVQQIIARQALLGNHPVYFHITRGNIDAVLYRKALTLNNFICVLGVSYHDTQLVRSHLTNFGDGREISFQVSSNANHI